MSQLQTGDPFATSGDPFAQPEIPTFADKRKPVPGGDPFVNNGVDPFAGVDGQQLSPEAQGFLSRITPEDQEFMHRLNETVSPQPLFTIYQKEQTRQINTQEPTAMQAFRAGARTSVMHAQRGLARAMGFEEASRKFDEEVTRWQPWNKGVAGTAGSVVGAAPLFVGAGLTGAAAAPSILIGVPLVFATGYGNAKADIEKWEEATGAEVPSRTKQLVSIGRGLLDAAFSRFSAGRVGKAVEGAVVKKLGQQMKDGSLKEASKLLVTTLGLKGAEGAAAMGVVNTVHNWMQQSYDDEKRLFEGTPEAMALGAVLTGGMSLVGGAAALRNSAKLKKAYVDLHLLKPEEAKILGSDVKTMVDIAKARQDGLIVDLTQTKNKAGETVFGIKTRPDNVSWRLKEALGHNEPLIDLYRKEVQAGRMSESDILLPRETGPLRQPEIDAVTAGLKMLSNDITLDPQKDFNPANGSPMTKRALLHGDIEFLIDNLAKQKDTPQGRRLFDQATALIEAATKNKLAASTDPIPPLPIGPRDRVLTPYDLTKNTKLKIRPELAKARGFLVNPEKLTTVPSIRRKIHNAQKRFFANYLSLRKNTQLSPEQVFFTGSRLEADFIERMEVLMESANDTRKGARATVAKALEKSKDLPPKAKALAMSDIDRSLNLLAQSNTELTQKETIAHLIEDLAQPGRNTDPATLDFLDNLYGLMSNDRNYLPYGERVKQGLRDTQSMLRLVVNGAKKLEATAEGRAQVAKLAEDLPPVYSEPLLKRALAAKDPAELAEILKEVETTQKLYLKDSSIQEVLRSVKRLSQNPRKNEGLGRLAEALNSKSVKQAEKVLRFANKMFRRKSVYHGTAVDKVFEKLKSPTEQWRMMDQVLGPHVSEDPAVAGNFGMVDADVRSSGRVYPLKLSGKMKKTPRAFIVTEPGALTTKYTGQRFNTPGGKPSLIERISQGRTQSLTPDEARKLEIAKNPGSFSKISDAHRFFGQRFQALVDQGVLHGTQAEVLRYLFSDISPEVMKTVKQIRGRRPDETYVVGDYEPANRDLRLSKYASAYGHDPVHVFAHEFMHGAFFNFLGFDTIKELAKVHGQMVKDGSARRLLAESAPNSLREPELLDYYSGTLHEFFAEMGARHVLGKRVSHPVLAKIFDKVYDRLRLILSFFKQTDTLPQEFKQTYDKLLMGDPGEGKTFIETTGRDTDAITKQLERYEAKGVKPVISKSEKTGNTKIDLKALKERLGEMEPDQLQMLAQDMTRFARKGEIEKGLYRKYRKYQTADDVGETLKTLNKFPNRSERRERLDTPEAVAKALIDPVSTEGWLAQKTGFDKTNPLYKIFVGEGVPAYSRTMRHVADARKNMVANVKEFYGWDTDTSLGEWKFLRYMTKPLANGIQRDEAMWAYAIFKDPGRRAAIIRDGIEARGKSYDLKETLRLLSKKDKAYVDKAKQYFQGNPMVEKAFKTFLKLNGFESEKIPGAWFTSRRNVEPMRQPKDFNDYELHLLKQTDALRARAEDAKGAFKLDGGFVSAYQQVADHLARYGEMGEHFNRVGNLMVDPEFRKSFVSKFGEQKYKELQSYLQDKMGVLGMNPSGMDTTISYLTKAKVGKEIGLNVWSASKQILSLLTAMGDDVLDTGTIISSIADGSFFDKKISKRFMDESGVAYNRLRGSRFADQLLVMGQKQNSPKLAFLQDKAFVLQKLVDERTLRVLWRAAEKMAEKKGLKGQEAKEFTVDKFETAVTRAQTSDSPIYRSEFERYARKHPAMLGVLAFKRELNRMYNTTRRHVVRAAQEPSEANVNQALKSVFFTLVAGSMAELGINELRKKAFGQVGSNSGQIMQSYLQNLMGMFYLSGDAARWAPAIWDEKQRDLKDRDLGIVGSIVRDLAAAGWNLADAATTDPDERFESGPRRGKSKQEAALIGALDKSLSFSSSMLGLPFWGMWNQANGLYNWKRDDYRLMAHLEAEKAELDKNPNANVVRLGRIERLKEKINEWHRKAEKKLVSPERAQEKIVELLKRDRDS